MTDRCYNCGEIDHTDRQCTAYGPRFPEPGKTSLDYADEYKRIMDLVAQDIIDEHAPHAHQEDEREQIPGIAQTQ